MDRIWGGEKIMGIIFYVKINEHYSTEHITRPVVIHNI